MRIKTGIKVYAPAAIANFCIGLNIISVAVDEPGDEIIASVDTKHSGIRITSLSGFKEGISKEVNSNSATLAGQYLLDHLQEKIGISFRIHKKIPINSGFSSNASSAVAGVYAVNELLGRPMERYDLLPFAEKAASRFNHTPFPAQVCSILFGGIILYKSQNNPDFQKLYCPHGIQLTLIFPEMRLSEKEKIGNYQKTEAKWKDSIQTGGNIASMVSALYTSNFNLLAQSIQDNELNKRLKQFYPYFDEINDLSIQMGAYGSGFAGLGPGMFIASPNSLIADEISLKLSPIFKKSNLNYSYIQTKINLNGVFKY